MKRASAFTLVVLTILAGGCASPGIIRDLPNPVFPTVAKQPTPPVAVTPKPTPAPQQPDMGRIGAATIVVDAGHGGHDPGAQGVSAAPEKTVNLSVAMHLAARLEGAGAEVITTRNTDRFIPLDGRAALAERARADLFVSIHADAAQRASVSGATVYIARNASRQSQHAAEAIIAALDRAGIECRGIHRAGFRVLVGHSRPAVLIECGFLTNHADAGKLNNSSYQAELAEVIAEGIVDHFRS